jgi:putative ABC transport system permease protein
VLAVALIIGIGTGVYAGLGSTAEWRRQSNDASFAMLHMYDLRVTAAEGVDAPTGAMARVLTKLPDPSIVTTAEERFIADTQVDASTADRSILVPGRIVGMDLTGGGPHLNGVHVAAGDGRQLSEADTGRPVVLTEQNLRALL